VSAAQAVHVLVDCPRLNTLRQKLRKDVGDAFNNVSLMLGGRGQSGQEGKISSSAQDSILNAVLDFAEASQRFVATRQKGRIVDPQRILAIRGPKTRHKFRLHVMVHCKWILKDRVVVACISPRRGVRVNETHTHAHTHTHTVIP
jgi:hypothetical protein